MEKKKTYDLVLTALMTCMVLVLTFIIRIPVPATNGYIHLGDTMIFLSVFILGWKKGALASATGSAMADLLAGYAHYIPVTFVVKGLMAIVAGLLLETSAKKNLTGFTKGFINVLALVLAGAVMVLGYYVAESFMYGSWITPLASIPMNCIQLGAGVVLASALKAALKNTSLMKY
jgi:uncharacterized membrane protein